MPATPTLETGFIQVPETMKDDNYFQRIQNVVAALCLELTVNVLWNRPRVIRANISLNVERTF